MGLIIVQKLPRSLVNLRCPIIQMVSRSTSPTKSTLKPNFWGQKWDFYEEKKKRKKDENIISKGIKIPTL